MQIDPHNIPLIPKAHIHTYMEKLGKDINIPKEWLLQWFNFDYRFAISEICRVGRRIEGPITKGTVKHYFQCLPKDKERAERVKQTFSETLMQALPWREFLLPGSHIKIPFVLKTQYIVRELAKHIFSYILSQQGSSKGLFAYLNRVNAFYNIPEVLREDLIQKIVDKCTNILTQPLDEKDWQNRLQNCFKNEIYSLELAETLIKTLNILKSRKKPLTKEYELKEKSAYEIAVNSLFVHLAQLQELHVVKEKKSVSFFDHVKNAVDISTPLVEALLNALVNEQSEMKANDKSILLQTIKPQDPFLLKASTLLATVLDKLGWKVSIYFTRRINFQLSPLPYHCFILVHDRTSDSRVIVDPLYSHFLPPNIQSKTNKAMLVLKLDEREKWLQNFQKGKVPQSYQELMKTLWNPQTYDKIDYNLAAESMYDMSLPRTSDPGLKAFDEVLESVGLRDHFVTFNSDRFITSLILKYTLSLSEDPNLDTLRSSLLDQLHSVSYNCRWPILKDDQRTLFTSLLGLQTRFLAIEEPEVLGFYMSTKEQINPKNEPLKAIYSSKKTNISTPLITLNAKTVYLVDPEKIDCKKLQSLLENPDHGELEKMSLVKGREMRIFKDLKKLEVDLKLVKVEEAPEFGGITLQFPWSYEGKGPLETYTVNFVQAEITKPHKYPSGFNRLLKNGGIDVYLQKDAGESPAHFADYLPQISNAVKVDGFIALNVIDGKSGEKHDPLSILDQAKQKCIKIQDAPLVASYRKLITINYSDIRLMPEKIPEGLKYYYSMREMDCFEILKRI